MPVVLLTYYCALILVASIIGGMIPAWFQLTHRWMQFAVSFVAGVMLGVAVLHMLPHAIVDAVAASRATGAEPTAGANTVTAVAAAPDIGIVIRTMTALLGGMLVMFFIERFFSFHHHDAPAEHDHSRHDHSPHDANRQHAARMAHSHDLSWSGAALGLALHSILNGVALAAAVLHGSDGRWLPGLGTFLVVFLHKPFDAMTIGMLMARGGWSMAWRNTVNALFSLAIPIGVVLFYVGLMRETSDPGSGAARLWVAYALAFSAGTFLCISLSDLLPELQFHQHDRVKLSLALLFGLAVAYAAGRLEAAAHAAHSHTNAAAAHNVPNTRAWLQKLAEFA